MDVINLILNIFNGWFSWGICIFGLIVLSLLIKNSTSLKNKKDDIVDKLNRRNMKYNKNTQTGELEETEDTDAAVTSDTIRAAELKFNQTCSKHNAISQLIPVFPLLGVLGTVFGLIKQASAENIVDMLSSLDIALGTTVLGLIFGIVLKIYDALISSRIISDTEVLLDDYDKKMELGKK